MQNPNWRLWNRVIVVALATLLAVSFSTFAVAQGKGAAAVAMFNGAAKDQTKVAGVSIIADRPKGFNPLTASSEELGKYGLPQRPDQQADPKGYANWAMGMSALKYRAGNVAAKPYSSTNLRMAKSSSTTAATSATPTSLLSSNWSGVANTNKLTEWNNNTSFDEINSVWNVPAVQPPFGACANPEFAYPYPFLQVSWNGIDGANNGDVIQGGSLGYADCGGPADTFYFGWVEWYPSYAVLEIFCDYGNGYVPCVVNAGDDFWVITYGANAGTQYVFVEDITQQWYGTFGLGYITGPLLVGSSEEQVVERPCCYNGNLFALANYIYDFFDYSYGYDGRGTQFYAGEQTPATWVISMVDDADDQTISAVAQGTQGYQGKYSLWFYDENCASSGGCTP